MPYSYQVLSCHCSPSIQRWSATLADEYSHLRRQAAIVVSQRIDLDGMCISGPDKVLVLVRVSVQHEWRDFHRDSVQHERVYIILDALIGTSDMVLR